MSVLFLVVLLVIVVFVFFYSGWIEPRIINVIQISVISKKIGNRFNILHLSDFHLYRKMSRKRYLILKNEIKRLSANIDLILITGDIVDHNDGIDLIPELFEDVKPKIGTFAVLGNHDYYQYNFLHIFNPLLDRIEKKEIDQEKLGKFLRESGIRLLKDEAVKLDFNQNHLYITGVDALSFKSKKKLSFNYDKERFKIILSHYPDIVKDENLDADLILCGHTHGGQITFFGLPLTVKSKIKASLARGMSIHDEKVMIVSKGLGMSRYFPLRFFAVPDVMMIQISGGESE